MSFSSNVACGASLHPQEARRLASVCGVCESTEGRDGLLDAIAQNAASVVGTPIGAVTLLREDDQVFVGRFGTSLPGTPREESLCAHAILQDGPLVVEDATRDARFSGLGVVVGPPYVRFYAGVPILDVDELPLGVVCVIDTEPRSLDFHCLTILERLAVKVGVILETRRLVRGLVDADDRKHEARRTIERMERILRPLGAPLHSPRGHARREEDASSFLATPVE